MILTQVEIAVTQISDTEKAVQQVTNQVINSLGVPEFAMVFFTEHYDENQVQKSMQRRFKRFIGASVPGVIHGEKVYTKAVAVCGLKNGEMEVATALYPSNDHDKTAEACGEKIAEAYEKMSPDNGTLLLFPDGFSLEISMLLRGIYNKLGTRFTYIGGGTGDNLNFYQTFQMTEDGVASHAVAAALLNNVKFNTACGHGWEPNSEPVIITRSEGKRVYEIDGEPAFKRYAELIGISDKRYFSYYGMQYPIGLSCTGDQYLIRDPLCANEDDSIEFVTEVPQNTAAVIMKGDIDRLIEAAAKVTKTVSAPGQKLTLVCDCVSRYLLMKDEFQWELQAINENAYGEVFGVLTFGEVYSVKDVPLFFNKTITVLGG